MPEQSKNRKFRLMQGTHGTPKQTYKTGDVIETDEDLATVWNKHGYEPRFVEFTGDKLPPLKEEKPTGDFKI